MPAGRSQAEREALRERYLGKAIEQGRRRGVTLRCARVMDDQDHPDHKLCRGEEPGGTGCLDYCHDKPDAVAEDRDWRCGFCGSLIQAPGRPRDACAQCGNYKWQETLRGEGGDHR